MRLLAFLALFRPVRDQMPVSWVWRVFNCVINRRPTPSQRSRLLIESFGVDNFSKMIRAIPKKPTGSIRNQMIVGRNPSRYGEFTTNKDPKPEPKIKQKPQRES